MAAAGKSYAVVLAGFERAFFELMSVGDVTHRAIDFIINGIRDARTGIASDNQSRSKPSVKSRVAYTCCFALGMICRDYTFELIVRKATDQQFHAMMAEAIKLPFMRRNKVVAEFFDDFGLLNVPVKERDNHINCFLIGYDALRFLCMRHEITRPSPDDPPEYAVVMGPDYVDHSPPYEAAADHASSAFASNGEPN